MSGPDWGRRDWGQAKWGWNPGGRPWQSGTAAPHDRTRIYRDTERRWIAGVCAGIADYVETDPALVRLVAVLCLIVFFLPTLVAYVAFALVLKPKPRALFGSPGEESFWRGLRTDPAGTLHGIRERFGDLERRLARAETLVASDEFELRRRFRDIGG